MPAAVQEGHGWSGHGCLCVSVLCRMNNGPVIGYEDDVGRRTTFRLSYPESIFSDPIHYDPNTTVVLIVFKPRDLKWLWEILSGQKIVSLIIHALWLSSPHTTYVKIPGLLLTLVVLAGGSTVSPSQSAQYPFPISAFVLFLTQLISSLPQSSFPLGNTILSSS